MYILYNVLIAVLICEVSEIILRCRTLSVSEVVVTCENEAVRAKEACKLRVSRGLVYHTVSKLHYSARLSFRSVYLRINSIFAVR